MSDVREALARLVYDHEKIGRSCIGCNSCSGAEFMNGIQYAEHVADLLTAEFLIVPRSEIEHIEYGVTGVEGGSSAVIVEDRDSALRDAAEIRSLNLPSQIRLGIVSRAVSRPILPWTSIDEDASVVPCSDCGLPYGRQDDCRTCHGQPIPEDEK